MIKRGFAKGGVRDDDSVGVYQDMIKNMQGQRQISPIGHQNKMVFRDISPISTSKDLSYDVNLDARNQI